MNASEALGHVRALVGKGLTTDAAVVAVEYFISAGAPETPSTDGRAIEVIGRGITPFYIEKAAERILLDVSASNSLPLEVLCGKSRTTSVVAARHEAMSRLRNEVGLSLPRIGAIFNCDHTSVLHAVRKHGVVQRAKEAQQ